MVDIFEIVPQGHNPRTAASPFLYGGQDARVMRYQNLLSKISGADSEGDGGSESDGADGVYVDWLPQDQETIEMRGAEAAGARAAAEDKPLVGTFADAAAAMG
jgi:hypothetical protein